MASSAKAVAAFYAELVNSDRYLPVSAISNTLRDAMVSRGLVTPERLRMRGSAMSHQGPIRRGDARKGAGAGARNGNGSGNGIVDGKDRGADAGREARGRRAKRALGVQALLEWAFRVEKVQLELPERGHDDPAGDSHGFGMEHVLYQRAQLGCRIDGGRYKSFSHPHEDAEVVAAAVVSLPDTVGGRRMAIRVAELARARLAPDWMPGSVPRCVPVEITRNQHGERATTVVVGLEQVLSRGRWRSMELLACPLTWIPHPGQIEGARRANDDCCQARAGSARRCSQATCWGSSR